jgi:hypothetical protein
MKYVEALERMKLGKKVAREGRVFAIRARGIFDVTNEEVRAELTDDDRKASDWESAE